MDNISNKQKVSTRDLFYFRQRLKNKIFQSVLAYFNDSAKNEGLTKKDIATLLGKDPAQITRWFSGPKNWTLDTISDLLLAMDAEIKHEIVPLHDNRHQITSMDSAEKAAYPIGIQDHFKMFTAMWDIERTQVKYLPANIARYIETKDVALGAGKGGVLEARKGGALEAWYSLCSNDQSQNKLRDLDLVEEKTVSSGLQL